MRTLLILFFIGTCINLTLAQDVILGSQADVDVFDSNITVVNGNLVIGDLVTSSDIVDLSNLNNLIEVTGSLQIVSNLNLENLEGLNGLIKIGEFLSLSNNGIKNLAGLTSLSQIGRNFTLYENLLLENFQGLDDLTEIQGSFTIISGFDNQETALVDFSGLENLKRIEGKLSVDFSSSLESMNGLSGLEEIGGNLEISSNTSLESLQGLDNLKQIDGSVRILYNELLASLEGLGSLIQIAGDFNIGSNKSLESMTGLESLGSIGGRVKIDKNDTLKYLTGLENLTQIGKDVEIGANKILEDLSGLENLVQIGGDINLYDNSALDYCCALSLFTSTHTLVFTGNKEGCNSGEQIEASCPALSPIAVSCFYDLNENGIKENDEPSLSNVPMLLGLRQFYTSENEIDLFYDRDGDKELTIELSFLQNWEVTTDSMNYQFYLDENFTNTLIFGLKPISLSSDVNTSSNAQVFRCNFQTILNVNVINEGTTTCQDGILWIELDESLEDVVYIDTPDIIESAFKVGWNFTDFYPTHHLIKQVRISVPGVEVIDLGTEFNYTTYMTGVDQMGSIESDTFIYTDFMACGYDPNDKLVQPVYYENYNLIDEALYYTIRFQNTGNAEAFDVTVYDQLDEHLDVNTFRLIGSSHSDFLTTSLIGDGRVLRFHFEGINLPDSLSDSEGSQGYIHFSIKSNEELEDGSLIENEANIYFDLNPPIVTNITSNIMFTSFDYDEDGFMFWNDCDDYNENAFPDNTEIPNNGIDEDCDGVDLMVSTENIPLASIQVFPNPAKQNLQIKSEEASFSYKIINSLGQLMKTSSSFGEGQTIDVSAWLQGVYYVELQLEDGERSVKKVMVVD